METLKSVLTWLFFITTVIALIGFVACFYTLYKEEYQIFSIENLFEISGGSGILAMLLHEVRREISRHQRKVNKGSERPC